MINGGRSRNSKYNMCVGVKVTEERDILVTLDTLFSLASPLGIKSDCA